MIISHTHRFIFFSSSKVGTTSMEHVLAPLHEGLEYEFGTPSGLFIPKHMPPAILKGAFPDHVWESYFKFVFVRNPWDWFVSQWFYNSVGPQDRREAQGSERSRGRSRWAMRLRDRRAGRKPTGRPAYSPPTPTSRLQAADVDAVFGVLKGFRGLPGRDSLYQSNWVYDMDDRQIVDFVGRYETLQADFDRVMRHLKLDLALPHLNRTRHEEYRSYYSDEARDRVAQLWALDIRNFSYVFGRDAAGTPSSVQDAHDPDVRVASESFRTTSGLAPPPGPADDRTDGPHWVPNRHG
jgi:hypothetical protein